jgi:DNA ligase D-like protein (predicted polymerase)
MKDQEILDVGGREVIVTNPGKVYFPGAGYTKLDLVRYYVAVADGALRGVKSRPMVLKRWVEGAEKPPFFQKRAPKKIPEYLETVTLSFPSGRTANELVVNEAAGLAWVANLGCLDLNPHPVRDSDLDHPDELRVDLDPVPGVGWKQIVEVAKVVRSVLLDVGLLGFPKTSGSRGIHVYVRISAKWGFREVRRAAVALAREVERRAPGIATSKWWKEERQGVFIDYNQNAKDRTVASAYSVRPLRDARVSMPLSWEDLEACDPGDFTLATVPAMFAKSGDAHARIDDVSGSLENLLGLAERQESDGAADAPWPPHYPKQPGEPPRVAPSRAKKDAGPTKTQLRRAKHPLIVIAKSSDKGAALAGLERWKAKYPRVAELLRPEDVLVDAMRGRYTTWTRIRINLGKILDDLRPPDEPPDPDDAPKMPMP